MAMIDGDNHNKGIVMRIVITMTTTTTIINIYLRQIACGCQLLHFRVLQIVVWPPLMRAQLQPVSDSMGELSTNTWSSYVTSFWWTPKDGANDVGFPSILEPPKTTLKFHSRRWVLQCHRLIIAPQYGLSIGSSSCREWYLTEQKPLFKYCVCRKLEMPVELFRLIIKRQRPQTTDVMVTSMSSRGMCKMFQLH